MRCRDLGHTKKYCHSENGKTRTETNLQAHRVSILFMCDAKTEATHTLSELRTQPHECPCRLDTVLVRYHTLQSKRQYKGAQLHIGTHLIDAHQTQGLYRSDTRRPIEHWLKTERSAGELIVRRRLLVVRRRW